MPTSALNDAVTAGPGAGCSPRLSFVDRLVREMNDAWHTGECPSAEAFFARHPEAAECPEAALRLVIEEVSLRRRHGEVIDAPALLARYPRWRGELERLLQVTKPVAPPPEPLPAAGMEVFNEFTLVRELGRGSEGIVFLARRGKLADRPVVLKITRSPGAGQLALTRLQHTGIVPLSGAYHDESSGRHALCMPFFGSATFAAILGELADLPAPRRSGAALVRALDRVSARAEEPLPGEGPARDFLEAASYPDAVAWIGARLAEALEYAHERRLNHLDLKPSNVLLAADGQPMLLDFHVAQAPLRPGGPCPPWFGGTPGYLSPEQARVCDDAQEGRPASAAVDGRSDVYSLGVVLYEALAGATPPPADPPPLTRLNPAVSVGLADLVHKCLAADPARRYPSAALLAADLRRHLDDLALAGVPNRSPRELWAKWRRRHPRGPLAALVGLATTLRAARWWNR